MLSLIKSYRTKQSRSNIDRVGFLTLVLTQMFLSLMDVLPVLLLESSGCVGGPREADEMSYM